MADNDTGTVAVFKTVTIKNEAKSKQAGRPIYDEMEVCEMRYSADRNTVNVQPAHHVWKWITTPEGEREPMTYAMRFREQYARFKAGAQQAKDGTPLEELTFLTASRRMELKALNIYTAEQLAALDGQPLKNLGMGGRSLVEQSKAYMAAAAGTADVTRLADENATLKERLAQLERQVNETMQAGGTSNILATDELSDEQLKERVAELTGSRPRGNPNRETLLRRLSEASPKETEAA